MVFYGQIEWKWIFSVMSCVLEKLLKVQSESVLFAPPKRLARNYGIPNSTSSGGKEG